MSDFINYLTDVFSEFGEIQTRRMFGGHGIYHDGAMFGLVADDMLYLKVDEENIDYFQTEELPAFEYEKQGGKLVQLSFHLAPEYLFDDPTDAALWASRSWEAARRAKAARGKK